MRKCVFRHMRTAKAQVWANAQTDQGIRCPLTELLDTTECINGEQSPGWYFAHAPDDLNLRMRIIEGTWHGLYVSTKWRPV